MQHPRHIHFTNDATGLCKTSPGNTRVIPTFGKGQVFADKNGNGIIEVTNDPATCEILQENHYYPFGLNHEGPWLMNDAARDNLYQYNGKEWNVDFGLGLYDFGNRWHDPTLGRFTTVDRFICLYVCRESIDQ
jgi:RHS repeat-associated protein